MFLKKVVNFIIIGDFLFNFSDQGVEEGAISRKISWNQFFFKFSADEKGEKNEKKREFFLKDSMNFFLNFCFKNNTNEII